MNDSDSDTPPPKIIIAKWTDRFLAWLIDFTVISIISISVVFALFGTITYEPADKIFWLESIQYIPSSVIFFSYWTILEYKTGQTVGKKILSLRVTDIHGNNPSLKGVMISSFGKSFLLPIDLVLGWILTNEKRQRVFNKIGDTLVTKIKNADKDSEIKYLKD